MNNNQEIENKLKSAFNKITPDVFESIIEECEEIDMKEKPAVENKAPKRGFGRLLAMALTCFVFVAAIGILSNPVTSKASVITLDVNPGIEIHLNDDNETIEKVIPLNEDATTVLASLELKDLELNNAVNQILDSMLEKGYLTSERNSILVSIDCEDEDYIRIKEDVTNDINTYLKVNGIDAALISQIIVVDDAIEEISEAKDVSLGKLQLVNKLIESNPDYDLDDLLELNVNDLNLLLQHPNYDIDEIEYIGMPSDGTYIGKAKAQEIALTYMGVNEADVKDLEVEIDFKYGIMVYEVEYDDGQEEIDILVNALTGEILGHKVEIDDVDVEIEGVYQHGDQYDDDDDDDYIPEGEYISEDLAIETALANLGVNRADVTKLKTELENKNGVVVFEVEFKKDGYEYEYHIDATTSSIIKTEIEIDD